MRTEKFVKAFQKASRPKTQGYDTQAEVRRVEGGTAWVHIPGGVDETPVRLTIDAKAGDTVQVRVSGGKAFLVGNATAPPTDNTVANEANSKASFASEAIEEQQEHFWYDGLGAHIAGSGTYRNDLKSDGMHIVRVSDSTEVALFGASGAQIGISGESHQELDFNSWQMIDKDGSSYALIQDLRDETGYAAVTDTWTGDGATTSFDTSFDVNISHIVSCTVDGNAMTHGTDYNYLLGSIIFNTAPADGDEIVFSYESDDGALKNYTLGSRRGGYSVGGRSFVLGGYSAATKPYSCAIGYNNLSTGEYSFTAGTINTASKWGSVATGASCSASAAYAHAQNLGTKAASASQTAIGKYNVSDNADTYALIIGNGTSNNARSNALTVDWSGNVSAAGQIKSTTETYGISLPLTVTASTFELVRNGGVAMLSIVNIQTLPAGSTTICTLSSGWRPALDVMHVFNEPTASVSSDLRVIIKTSGELSIYNYGSAISSASNKSLTLCYVLA